MTNLPLSATTPSWNQGRDHGRNVSEAVLLHRFAVEHSESAFREFVQRTMGLVYSAAQRRSYGDPHAAEDIVQTVFTSVARNAEKLARHPALTAWLYAAVRNAAVNWHVAEKRRRTRETEAAMNHALTPDSSPADWEEIRRVLDPAMDELAEADRTAVLLRYFEHRSFVEIGRALNASENSARMRTERALDKLRGLLEKRGITSTAVMLGGTLISHAVTSAPDHLVRIGVAAGLRAVSRRAALDTGRSISKATKPSLRLGLIGMLVLTAVVVAIWRSKAGSHTLAMLPPRISAALERLVGERTSATASILPSTPKASSGAAMPRVKPVTTAPAAASAPITAEIVIQRMVDAYAALTSYEDSGEVIAESADRPDQGQLTFRTRFVRPNRYRFESVGKLASWSKIESRYAVISDGMNSLVRIGAMDQLERRLADAIVTSLTVTRGAGYHVPRILLDEQVTRAYLSPARLTDLQLLEPAPVEDVSCYVVHGLGPAKQPYTLWIGQKDYFLRKIVTTTPLNFSSSQRNADQIVTTLSEYHRDIRIDEPIADELFRLPSPAVP